MLKSLYDHFMVLYHKILPTNPSIASEHSLRQEQEVYAKSNKLTYRNVRRASMETQRHLIDCILQAVISSIASLKRRDVPQSVGDPTVGTEGDLAARIEAKKSLQSLRLTTSHLQPYLLSREDMITWGYVVDIPEGPGGDKPSEEGGVMKCERCKQPKQVRRMEEAEECVYHWGRLLTKKVSGEAQWWGNHLNTPTDVPSRRESQTVHVLFGPIHLRGRLHSWPTRLLRI